MSSAVDAAFSGAAAAAASRRRSTCWGVSALLNHGVSMKPGRTTLIRIFGASARASARLIVLSAALEAA